MELFIHSLSGAFSLCFQLTCKLHWPHLRKPFSPHLLTLPVILWIFPYPIALLCGKDIWKSAQAADVTRKGKRDDREHFSHSIAHRIAYLFRFSTPSFLWPPWFLMPFLTPLCQTGAGDPSLWMSLSSLARNPHYNSRLQRSRPQGHNMLPKISLSWQAVLRGQKWQCRRQLFFFVRGWGAWAKAKGHQPYQAGKVEQKVWPWPWPWAVTSATAGWAE